MLTHPMSSRPTSIRLLFALILVAAFPVIAHDLGQHHDSPDGSAGVAGPSWFASAPKPAQSVAAASAHGRAVSSRSLFPGLALFSPATLLTSSASAPVGNGALMAASFAPFKPLVRYYWDNTTFYEESDGFPDRTMMPNLMVGITSWQQQVPIPAAYFASVTNPEGTATSLGYGQPNYWRLPLVPVPASSPISLSGGNFQRGAVALASNGIPIFNPANNTGRVSYEIGELDVYGGHCGLADDYHYHIIPTHLLSAFGGVLGNDKPVAWALDGYPIYGYLEPDGTARQALDAQGGHDIGNGWGYHYHAIGTTTTDATHPYGTPASPYMMSAFHGTVVNFGSQVDGQPEVGSLRQSGTGGYVASPVSGASIVAFKNPVSLKTDTLGNLMEDTAGTASADSFLMRVRISGVDYDECWKINRSVLPHTLTMTWRLSGATTTLTYTPGSSTTAARLAAYTMGAWSQTKLPDTSQTQDTTTTFGEDADYSINAQSFTDNGNGTVTDNVTGLMWQKTDNGESTWDSALANAASVATGGYKDWRLPTPAELFSLFNHQNSNPALNTTYFPNNSAGVAEYWWTSDPYGSSTANIWCGNAGGGLGGKPKSETISASGAFRYHARYVRGAKPTNLHSYTDNLDGTVTDADTSLMWTQLPGAARTWEGALSYSENLSLGGYTDWRLPNIKELQTLTDYTLATATSATGIKPSINRTVFAKTLTNCITTSGSTAVTCADTTGLLAGMPLVAPSEVAASHISNTTPPTVASVTSATTFTMSAAATASGAGITLRALALPTAYWSSSSLKNTTTEAWVVETGVNTTSNPPRNSQGIISYDVKTASYPVFAVRTTSVATQMVVEQPSGSALTDGASTVNYSNVTVGSTSSKAFVIRNSGSTSLTITGVSIDGVNASNFLVTAAPAGTVAAGASTTMDVRFTASTAGNKVAGLHIATSDSAVGAAFDITLAGTGYVPPPTVGSPNVSPAVPGSSDSPYVTAVVTPASGATITSVQLEYNTGAQVTGPAFREIFASGSTTSGLAGAMSTWTSTTLRSGGAGDVKQRGNVANHTVPIVLTGCSTTSGSTVVTCASTTGLIPGMLITGPNIPSVSFGAPTTATTIVSITSATAIVLSAPASGTGTGLSLTAAGVTLTNWTSTLNSNTVTCSSTSGLVVGMGITAITTNPPNPTVASITSATTFTLNNPATASGSGSTLTAYGTGLEFSNGTTTYTDTMAAMPVINAGGASAGSVTFWVRTADLSTGNGWAFQVSSDGGTTWNTRLGEIFSGSAGHAFAQFSHTLLASELVANLRMRFQFSGNTVTSPTRPPTCDIDDITVNLTTGAPPATLVMYDDGAHGDGADGDGVYGAQLPAQISGTNVSYTITATDSNAATGTGAGGYTTGPSPTIVTSAALPGSALNAAYSEALAVSGGSGSGYVWSVNAGSSLPAGLSLSSSGLLSGTVTAAGSHSFTLKVTDGAGRVATRVFTLAVSSTTAPNVVIIVTDDQGWGDISYHTASGQVPVQTPNMARIGNEGIRLERFYATPVCATTRCALLTGRSSVRTGSGNQRGVDLSEHMMPQSFRSAGYQTFMCGKWHLGGWGNNIYTTTLNGAPVTVQMEGPEYHPRSRGWDFHYGQYGGAIGYFTHTTADPGLNSALDWWLNGSPIVETTDLQGNGGYSTDLLADRAVAQIVSRDKTKPMLLYLAFNGVHAGVQAPQSYIDKYTALGVTDSGRRTLCAAVDCMDAGIGRVLNALDSEGIASNTVVVYFSDNGGNEPSGSINDPLRGTKNDSYDGGIHTPAAIRWPGVLAAGVTSNQYVWVGDFFPTLAAATGVPPQNTKPMDGLNLWPALQSISAGNPNGSVRLSPLVTGASAPVAIHTYTDPVNGGAKVFKLIRNKSGTTSINELFNMTDDPYETTDLLLGANAASYSAIVTALSSAITSITAESYPPYIGPAGITQSVAQADSITLYAPFTSYGKTPSVQWRKAGVPVTTGTSGYSQVTSSGAAVSGVYMATLTLAGVNAASAGNYDVVVTSTSGSDTSDAGTLTVTRPVSTLNDGLPDWWKTANGISATSTAASDGPSGDIDGDGLGNLLEYAFATNPRAADSGIVQRALVGGYLQLTYPRRLNVVDLMYTVEVSEDLQTWSAAGAASEVLSTTPNADGFTENVTVRVLPAVNGAAKKFARVKVSTR